MLHERRTGTGDQREDADGGAMSEWIYQSIESLCSLIVDCVNRTAPIVDYVTPFRMIRTANIKEGRIDLTDVNYVTEEVYQRWTRRAVPQFGDVVLTREAPLGEVGMILEPGVFLGQRLVMYRADPTKANPRFLLYSLMSDYGQQQIKALGGGSTVEHMRVPDTKKLLIFGPSISEQHEIARILGSLDDKIALNRRMNAALEATARALFQSWFVDFDPVRAKAEGRQPEGMDAETAALFPDSFEESALGWIPSGWEVMPLSEAIEINPTRRLAQGALAPYLAMENMPTQSARPINWVYREAGSGARFINGDVLLARITPCLENGKTAYVDFLEQGQTAWGSTEYIVFRSKTDLPIEYPYFLARSETLREYAIRSMSGTSGRQRVNASAFEHYNVTVPSIEIAAQFGIYAHDTFVKMKANDDASRTLAEMRDALLPKLISGQVRVGEISVDI